MWQTTNDNICGKLQMIKYVANYKDKICGKLQMLKYVANYK